MVGGKTIQNVKYLKYTFFENVYVKIFIYLSSYFVFIFTLGYGKINKQGGGGGMGHWAVYLSHQSLITTCFLIS